MEMKHPEECSDPEGHREFHQKGETGVNVICYCIKCGALWYEPLSDEEYQGGCPRKRSLMDRDYGGHV